MAEQSPSTPIYAPRGRVYETLFANLNCVDATLLVRSTWSAPIYE
jgi:hypothetical protein